MRRHVVLAMATLAILLVAVETVSAQVFRGGRGWRGNSVGIYAPGFSFQYGTPYYGRGYYDGYWGRDGYWRDGYRDGYYYSSRPYRSYYYEPSYYSRPYYRSYYYEPSYYSSTPRYGTTWWGLGSANAQSYGQAGQGTQPVELRVVVPEPSARVWVEGMPTQQRGMERFFVSPPLENGRSFTYTIRASWMDNGREVNQERSVAVEAGQRVMIDFTSPADRADTRNATEKRHEGLVVRAGDGKLTITDLNGQNRQTHAVSDAATIQCDGTNCRLDDLREGQHVVATTNGADEGMVVRITAKTRE